VISVDFLILGLTVILGVLGMVLKKAVELILENEYRSWAPALARLLVEIAGFVCRSKRQEWRSGLLYVQKVEGESGLFRAMGCLVTSPLLVLRSRLSNAMSTSHHHHPPGPAEKVILLLVSGSRAEPLLGDLQEEFILISDRHGAKFARRWYWKQAIASIPSLLTWRLRGD
jgi:hypothetical protein